MKKLLFVLAFGLITSASFEQVKGHDYLTVKNDGKVYWIRGKETIKMMITVPLKNGSIINYKGIITGKDGETTQLMRGDKVMMDGTVIRKKTK